MPSGLQAQCDGDVGVQVAQRANRREDDSLAGAIRSRCSRLGSSRHENSSVKGAWPSGDGGLTVCSALNSGIDRASPADHSGASQPVVQLFGSQTDVTENLPQKPRADVASLVDRDHGPAAVRVTELP